MWVYDIGINTSNVELYGESYEGYVWAHVSHFSIYGISVNEFSQSDGDDRRRSGGGGGSDSGFIRELPSENITTYDSIKTYDNTDKVEVVIEPVSGSRLKSEGVLNQGHGIRDLHYLEILLIELVAILLLLVLGLNIKKSGRKRKK